ncbi:hypothetical protein NDU88_001274 [Pleurodeles waltl]|uniref:Uncharacterized protein n=1 Tax=Pleurodeles waltl TaxID=8319 RepID=A0AAV7RC40_PLEWA|nr:hypothetical protein NDU88_001274 [Pleurodeles waltl]
MIRQEPDLVSYPFDVQDPVQSDKDQSNLLCAWCVGILSQEQQAKWGKDETTEALQMLLMMLPGARCMETCVAGWKGTNLMYHRQGPSLSSTSLPLGHAGMVAHLGQEGGQEYDVPFNEEEHLYPVGQHYLGEPVFKEERHIGALHPLSEAQEMDIVEPQVPLCIHCPCHEILYLSMKEFELVQHGRCGGLHGRQGGFCIIHPLCKLGVVRSQ